MANIYLKNVSLEIPILFNERIKITKNMPLNKLGGFFKTDTNNTVNAVKVLNNINLKIESGDKVGLIGPNGAGKSTLLRLLAGVYKPTLGRIKVEGNVCSLLDAHIGMNDELSGAENLKIIGLYFGISKKKILSSMSELVDFTDLGDYISLPVKRYSSGMRLRLGFAITQLIKPDILLLDEMIGTGDIQFTEKTTNLKNGILDRANIVVLATHDIQIMNKFCNKAIYLSRGEIIHNGTVMECFDFYRDTMKITATKNKKIKKDPYKQFLLNNNKYKKFQSKWDPKMDKELIELAKILSTTELTIHFKKNHNVIRDRLKELNLIDII